MIVWDLYNETIGILKSEQIQVNLTIYLVGSSETTQFSSCFYTGFTVQYYPFITDELVEAVDSMDSVDIWPES